MNQLIIKKHPTKYEHLPIDNKFDFNSIINSVYLVDIVKYIIELDDPDKNDWLQGTYWVTDHIHGIHTSELEWAIFSYLVHNKILLIENKKRFSTKDKFFKDFGEEYVPRTSYYNLLESKLYVPILARLEDEGYLIRSGKIEYGMPFFKISKKYNRIVNLGKLGV